MDRDYRTLLQARVDQHVDRSAGPDACWPWTGTRKDSGYGQFKLNYRLIRAHRAAYVCFSGHDILNQPDVLVLHSCDNPPCCNPAHLRAGNKRDNTLDAMKRGRWVPIVPHGMRINAKLTPDEALAIATNAEGLNRPLLIEKYGVSSTTIDKIRAGKMWASVTGRAPSAPRQVQS